MKNIDLLEAIGLANEQYLHESEGTSKKKLHPVRRIALVAAVIAVFVFTVMASTGILKGLLDAGKNGATVANLSSGMGSFVYHEDSIYYGTFGKIYRYDMEGNVLNTYSLANNQEAPRYMFASEDAIVYVTNGASQALTVQPRDGSEPHSVDLGTEITNAYADGQMLYTHCGGTMLCRIDLVTMEITELLRDVSSYYVDDTYIYAVQTRGEKEIYRSKKDMIQFEPVTLDIIPNKVLAHGESLYICRWLDADEQKETGHRYGISLIEGNNQTNLPVYSWLYQVVGDRILYLEEGTNALKYYDRKTEETGSLAENVFTFSVFADRYICIEGYNEAPKVYDMTTGICNEVTIEQP